MTDFDGATGVVAVGASAGDVEALTRMAAGLTPGNIYVAVPVSALSGRLSASMRQLEDRGG